LNATSEPTYLETPEEFRAWLEAHHQDATELWVGFRKKGSGRPSITWPEAVDQALCFGWIDGVRKGVDPESYKIRFTPRKPSSIWSAVNIRRVGELTEQGLMRPAGLAAFQRRSEKRSAIYSYEQRHEARLTPEQEQRFRADREAWSYFEKQAPSYRQTAIYWVATAVKEETRERRLATLIEHSRNGERVPPLTPPGRR